MIAKHDQTRHVCSLCKHAFSRLDTLQTHLRKEHKILRDWRKYLVTIEAKITDEDMKEVFGENYKQK